MMQLIPGKASALSLREEWLSEDDMTGYHPEGGYTRMIHFLYEKCVQQNVAIKLITTQ